MTAIIERRYLCPHCRHKVTITRSVESEMPDLCPVCAEPITKLAGYQNGVPRYSVPEGCQLLPEALACPICGEDRSERVHLPICPYDTCICQSCGHEYDLAVEDDQHGIFS